MADDVSFKLHRVTEGNAQATKCHVLVFGLAAFINVNLIESVGLFRQWYPRVTRHG